MINRNIYCNIISRAGWIFTTGETSFVADALYNGAKVCIAPNLNDPETLLNAILIRHYNLGDDLAQVELMESYAIETIEKSYSSWNEKNYILKKEESETQLHMELEKICK